MLRQVIAAYGVLGVGSIATAIVTGLCQGVTDPPAVLLSPRNADAAAGLAARFASVSVASDNQSVVDGSAVVLLCLRAQDAGLLAELDWRPDHVVVSVMPGADITRLSQLVAPASSVARAIAMPAVATRSTTTAVHPPLPAVVALFDLLGGAVPVEDESAFTALYTASATVAPLYAYLATLVDWLVAQGVDPAVASRQLASIFAGALPDPDTAASVGFDELVKEIATPGGVNEQIATLMRQAGVFDAMRRAVDTVHRRLGG